MTKTHHVEFPDESAQASGERHDRITFRCSGDEVLSREYVNGVPMISGNRAGLVTLGEILIQIGLSDYKSGFHVHIREDFDGGKKEILVVGVGEGAAMQVVPQRRED